MNIPYTAQEHLSLGMIRLACFYAFKDEPEIPKSKRKSTEILAEYTKEMLPDHWQEIEDTFNIKLENGRLLFRDGTPVPTISFEVNPKALP